MVEKSGDEEDARRCVTGGWFEGTRIGSTGEMISGKEGPRGRHVIYSMYQYCHQILLPWGVVVRLRASHYGMVYQQTFPTPIF